MRHTPSSRRRLKAIGQRENRWMQDMNHRISKALVERNPKHTLFVVEDLTSPCCPVCGHTETSNRNKKIHLSTCKNCGYKSNDDRIGAMNLYRMGINDLADRQVPNTVVTE